MIVGNLNKNESRYIDPWKHEISSNYIDQNTVKGNFIWVRGVNRYSASAEQYVLNTGTFMSAPTVTGALALLWEQNPELTNEEIIKLAIHSGTSISCGIKLNVKNLLSPDIQINILNKNFETDFTLPYFHQDFFPDFNILINEFEDINLQDKQVNYVFRKLTDLEINQYAKPDIKNLLENNLLIERADHLAIYGIMYESEIRKSMIMLCLALDYKGSLMLIADNFVWVVQNKPLILNELIVRIAKDERLGKFENVYAKWETKAF